MRVSADHTAHLRAQSLAQYQPKGEQDVGIYRTWRAHSNEPAIVRTKVFISYAHEDASFMEEFRRMLQPAIGDKFELWTDKKIEPGEDWNSRIEKAMKSSSIALLLVSDHFFDSSYIMKLSLNHFYRCIG